MATSAGPQAGFQLYAYGQGLTLQAIESQVKKQVRLLELPSKTAVAVTLQTQVTAKSMNLPTAEHLLFKPASALKFGTDYLVEITPGSGLQMAPGAPSQAQFHVGYLQRVLRVGVGDQNKTTVDWIALTFSELIDKKLVASKTKVYDAQGKAVSVSYKPLTVNVTKYDVVVSLSPALPADKRMAIEVPVDIDTRAADKLDGKFTGKAGSGAFSLSVVPNDVPSRRWEPPAAP